VQQLKCSVSSQVVACASTNALNAPPSSIRHYRFHTVFRFTWFLSFLPIVPSLTLAVQDGYVRINAQRGHGEVRLHALNHTQIFRADMCFGTGKNLSLRSTSVKLQVSVCAATDTDLSHHLLITYYKTRPRRNVGRFYATIFKIISSLPPGKHVRSCIVYTWDHKSSQAFWAAMKVSVYIF